MKDDNVNVWCLFLRGVFRAAYLLVLLSVLLLLQSDFAFINKLTMNKAVDGYVNQ